jgi:hypothetical protein
VGAVDRRCVHRFALADAVGDAHSQSSSVRRNDGARNRTATSATAVSPRLGGRGPCATWVWPDHGESPDCRRPRSTVCGSRRFPDELGIVGSSAVR